MRLNFRPPKPNITACEFESLFFPLVIGGGTASMPYISVDECWLYLATVQMCIN